MAKLTQDELNAIRGRHAAASPGDWKHGDCIAPRIVLYVIPSSRPIRDQDIVYIGDTYADGHGQGRANMKFIAHAHQDIPALLDEVTRLQAALDYLRRKIDGYDTISHVADGIATGAVHPDGGANVGTKEYEEWIRRD